MSKKLIAVLIGTIVLTGLGISTLANAAKSNRPTQQLTLTTGKKTEMNTNQINKEEAAKMLAEIERRFQKEGINLTPEQKKQIQLAQTTLFNEMQLFFQESTMQKLGQLLLSAVLPEEQGSKLAESTGIGEPVAKFYTTIFNSLAPEQRPTWERIWKELGSERQKANQGITFNWETADEKATVAERRKLFEENNRKFKDAGLALTPQQEAQMWQAEKKLSTELLENTFKGNSGKNFIAILAAMMMSKEKGEIAVSSSVKKPLEEYIQAVDSILTPEQQKFWQQRFANENNKES